MFEEYTDEDTSGRGVRILSAVALGLIYLVLSFWIFERFSLVVAAAFPVAQFLYIGPLSYFAYKSGQKRAVQGWLIGAALAALLYSPCWGFALSYVHR